MSFEFKSSLKGFKTLSQRLQTAIKDGLRDGMDVWIDKQKQAQMSGRPGLRVVTRTLRRSWRTRVKTGLKGYRVGAYTTVKYAAPFEFGRQKVPSFTVPAHTRKHARKKLSIHFAGEKRRYRRPKGVIQVRSYRVHGYTKQVPKYLHLRESFKHEAPAIILKAMKKRFNATKRQMKGAA